MKFLKLTFLAIFLFSCSHEKGDLIAEFSTTVDRGLDGTSSKTLKIEKSIISGGPFYGGSSIAVTVNRGIFTVITKYEIYEAANSGESCVYNASYTVSDYEAQEGCIVEKETTYDGNMAITLDGLSAVLILGPDKFNNFSQNFMYNGVYYNLRFGEKYSNTTNGDSSSFSIKITKMDILLEDAIGYIY